MPVVRLLSVVLVLLATAPAGAAGLAPHRAFYRLSLDDAGAVGGVTGVAGGLVVEWTRVCDGWRSRQRIDFTASTAEGPGFGFDVRSDNWESLDGRRLRYAVRTYAGGRLDGDFGGEATLGASGGEARFTTPHAIVVPLPPGTLFPTAHLARLLAAAAGGDPFLSRAVFDGSGFDALAEVSASIGTSGMPGAGPPWPVALAYHKAARGDDPLPDFEIALRLAPDGVMRDLRLDYGDFVLKADLARVEATQATACASSPP